MKKTLAILFFILGCWQTGWTQGTIENIRERYASFKEYIANHTGTNQYDGGEWAEYYHLEGRINLPATGGHVEDLYMYWDEYGDGEEELIYAKHCLAFATKKYNYAAREYYEEYMFDCDGNPQFIYGFSPMWTPDDASDDEQYEFRFYLNKGKLVKAIVKKRADDQQPFKEVYSGNNPKDVFKNVLSTFLFSAESIRQLFINIEEETYSYSE